MDQPEYNLLRLLPEFGRIIDRDFTSPEGLSALIVSLLLIIVAVFSTLSLANYMKAVSRVSFYQNLISGIAVEQLLEKRREISNNALQSAEYGRLWREFDESLVHVPDKNRLCNTLDASHFFNPFTLAKGLTENRMVAAVPGFLTAIGVIGTFAGLQMGLSSLSQSMGDSPQIDGLTDGIFGMIGGASIAFMTSVWGVFTSVVFNFYEKWLERKIRARITTFQNNVDYLFPRITAEQSLANIEDSTRSSNERLAELDEKIGHKMQEAMREASTVIREGMEASLTNILGPAIETLVNNATSGSEKALESLMERFLDGIGSAGQTQKDLMNKAAADMAIASASMTDGLGNFATRLESQIEAMAKKNSDILKSVEETVNAQLREQRESENARQSTLKSDMEKFIDTIGTQVLSLSEKSAQTMATVEAGLNEQIKHQRKDNEERQGFFKDQINSFQNAQQEITGSLENIITQQKDQNDVNNKALTELLIRFSELATSNRDASTEMHRAAEDLKSSSTQLGQLSSSLSMAINKLGTEINRSVDSSTAATELAGRLAQSLQHLIDDLSEAGNKLIASAEAVATGAAQASKGLENVKDNFTILAKSLDDSVQTLSQKIAELLDDYSERVKNQTVQRMTTWNEQTNQYISSMTDAVRALNDVVDEIDGKISSANHRARD